MIHLKVGHSALAALVLGSAATVGAVSEIPSPVLQFLQPLVDSFPMLAMGLLGIMFWVAKRFMDLLGPEIKDQALKMLAMPTKADLASQHKDVLAGIEALGTSLEEHKQETTGALGEIRGQVLGLQAQISGINERLNARRARDFPNER